MPFSGERYEQVERNVEGVLFRVMAMSGPIVFLKVYPVPVQLEGEPVAKPWNGVFKYTDMEWQLASKGFVRTYLKQMKVKPPSAPRQSRMLTAGEISDIFRLPGQDPPGRKFK